MDKKLLITFSIFAAVLILIILNMNTSSNRNVNGESETVRLSFRITWEKHSGRGDAIDGVVSDFNERGESIEVDLLGGDEEHSNIIEILSSDSPPDVIVLPYRELKNRETLKYLHPIGDYLSSEAENYYPEILKLGMSDEKILYGIPWIGHSMCFIYNRNILDLFGIDPAEILSFDDLLDTLEKICSSGDYVGIGLVGAEHHDLSWMTTQFIHSFGGSLYDEASGTISINSYQTAKALDFYINGLGKYAQSGWENDNGVDVMEKFAQGDMAFEIQGPWGITDIWKRGNPFEMGTFSFNQIGGCSETGPLMICVSSKSFDIHRNQILKFVKYMIGKEALEKVMLGEFSPKHQEYYPFRVPVRKDMENGTFFKTFPEFRSFTYGFEKPSLDTPSEEWSIVREKVYIPLLHETVSGKLGIDEFLNEVKIQGEKILAESATD